MQYPHWLMVAGAVLVMLGFLGLYFVAGTLSPINSLWKMRLTGNEMPATDSTSPLDASERLFGRTTEARFASLKLTMKSMATPEKVTPLKRAL